MAVPRPVILALLGVAAIVGVFVMTRGSGGSNGTVTPAPVATTAQPAPARIPAKKPAPVTKPAAPKAHGTPAAKPQHAASAARAQTTPPPTPATPQTPDQQQFAMVVSDLNAGEVVVVSFSQAHGADDAGTRAALVSLIGMPNVAIHSAPMSALTVFHPLLQGVGISQLPAVVVMHSGQKARLVEGFVDGGTLRQIVADEQG